MSSPQPLRVVRGLRKVAGARPTATATGSAASASLHFLRREFRRKHSLRTRLGLLKHKTFEEELDESERLMLDHELAIAAELQANLLPDQTPRIPGFDISAYYQPTREVGGDYYDFFEIDGDHVGFVVADVSGKGIPGSIVMTETRALMISEAPRTLSPVEVFLRINRTLYDDLKRGMFVTMFYGVLSTGSGAITVGSAGHNPMVLWRRATNTCHLVNPPGMALGIDRGPLFEKTVREQRIQLQRGDRFVLYTDGVVEAMNEWHEMLGVPRFASACRQYAERGSGDFVGLLNAEIQRHRGKAPLHDDLTLVTGRLLPKASK